MDEVTKFSLDTIIIPDMDIEVIERDFKIKVYEKMASFRRG